jgi:hypothetical protein
MLIREFMPPKQAILCHTVALCCAVWRFCIKVAEDVVDCMLHKPACAPQYSQVLPVAPHFVRMCLHKRFAVLCACIDRICLTDRMWGHDECLNRKVLSASEC